MTVGYLLNKKEGLVGEPGQYYDYLVGSNGVYIRAENPLISATIPVARGKVRGLEPLAAKVELLGGKIPLIFYHLALSVPSAMPDIECCLLICWDGERYRFGLPPQQASATGLTYMPQDGTVVCIHSHGRMGAFFSGIDNRDEQGLCIYMVVGKADQLYPEVKLRVGAYGYFAALNESEVFGGVSDRL